MTPLRGRSELGVKAMIVVLAVGIALIAFFSPLSPPSEERTVARRVFLIPPQEIARFTLGYNELVADVFWLRLIQDLDQCGTHGVSAVVTSVEEGQKIQELMAKRALCQKGWSFHMLDAITELAPRFESPYTHGAPTLSIIVDDDEGARIIYDKGVARLPKKWSVAMGAAYHYLIELKDPLRAAQLLVQAGQNGAPSWVVSLAARLYTEAGQAMLAKVILSDALRRAEETGSPFQQRLRERLVQADQVLERERQKNRDGAGESSPAQQRTNDP